MKILNTLFFLLLIFCNMGTAQDNPGRTDIYKINPIPVLLPPYEFEGVKYIGKGYYFDSVYIEKDYQISVSRADTTTLWAGFKIKGIGVDKYFVMSFDNIYQVYSSGKNTQKEEKLILSYVQDYKERLKKEKEEVERQRKFIADNPWPYKTVFRGNTYTKTKFKDTDQSLGEGWSLKKIGETNEYLKGDTAYPKDYEWQEGQSLYSEGTSIYALEGVGTIYYIYLDGYLYANDAKKDTKLEDKVKKYSQDQYRKISWARAKSAYEYNLYGTYMGGSGFSPNTIQKMVDLEYPDLDQPVSNNSLLQICALYLDISHYPTIQEIGVVSGYIEIDFKTTTQKNKEFNVQNYELPMAEIHDLKKKVNTNFHFGGVENSTSYRLYSELIDNEIPDKAVPTSRQKPNLDNLLIRLANNTYRSISYQDLPYNTQKAIERFIWASLQTY